MNQLKLELPTWFPTATFEYCKAIQNVPCPEMYEGKGIVLCGGGDVYGTLAERLIKTLRDLGCKLPIEVWKLDEEQEIKLQDNSLIKRSFNPPSISRRRGWMLKTTAIKYSNFREVLYIDVDSIPLVNPTFLFDRMEYKSIGMMVWGVAEPNSPHMWEAMGMLSQNKPTWEVGQIVINKEKGWTALSVTDWLNQQADYVYRVFGGDAFCFELGWYLTRTPYFFNKPAERRDWGLLHFDPDGKELFEHRCWEKYKG